MEETSNFYFLYNIKQEPIPDEEEWALRYQQFIKRVPPMEDGDESDVLSDVEEEFDETNVRDQHHDLAVHAIRKFCSFGEPSPHLAQFTLY